MGANTFSNTSNSNQLEKIQVGFLCYDLQPFTEDCLYRISQAISPINLKAYPVIFHPHQEKARITCYRSFEKGRHFGVNITNSTLEGFASNLNWRAAWKCVHESDIIFLFGLQGATALLVGLLGMLMRRTIISVNQTLPVAWEQKRRWWIRLLKSWLLNRCEYHLYQTPVSREVLQEVYKIDKDRLFFAPFEAGASLFKKILEKQKSYKDKVRGEIGITDGVLYLFVGNMVPFKGISDMIEGATLLPRGSKFICVFVGPEEPSHKIGGTIDYFMGIACKLGVDKYMRFLGALSPEKLASVYWAADVIVLPTHKDCFPKVLVEGALAGKPLITTNANGAAGTIVINGDNGFVIETGDAQALADAMARLLDSDLRKMMGRRSMEIVEDFCDLQAETEGYVKAIRHACLQSNM